MERIAIGVLGFAHAHVQTYCARWAADAALGIRVAAQGRNVLRMVLACYDSAEQGRRLELN